ncbi:hypothetical protein BH11MYX1_BH11MYX1_57910 [soil metagenome]
MKVPLSIVAMSAVVLASGIAIAGIVTAPPGWTATDSSDLGARANEAGHFGGQAGKKVITAAELKPAKADAGVSLFVTRVAMTVANDPAAVRAEVDQFHGGSRRAQLSGSTIAEQGWQEKVDDAAQQVEANLAFKDPANHVAITSRLVIAATADQLISVTGECIARDDADASSLSACRSALATLDPGAATRTAITLAPAGTPPPPREEIFNTGPSMSDGSHIPIPPMVIQPEGRPAVDRRPVFIGAVIVVLAGALWWNMKRRAKYGSGQINGSGRIEEDQE